jgi:hypothetical protein
VSSLDLFGRESEVSFVAAALRDLLLVLLVKEELLGVGGAGWKRGKE